MSGGSSQLVTIVDYGMGNLHSVRRQLERIGARTLVSSDPAEVLRAEKLVLPGVGHFGRAMQNLHERHLVDALTEVVMVRRAPILGICLGMQLMAQRSEEGEVAGLGWIDAEVVRFRVPDQLRFKVPHVGWNQVIATRASTLLKNLPVDSEFYFVHSYHLATRATDLVCFETEYAYRFASGVETQNLFGVQLHPEKSHDVGTSLLKNFLGV